MSTIFDRNLLPEFESVRDDNEEILWTEKPTFIPYLITGLGIMAGAVIFIGLILIFTLIGRTMGQSDSGFSWFFILLPFGLSLFSFLKKLLAYNNTIYAYTNRRVMIRTGFIGANFKSIDYDKISEIEVTVNFVENAYDVGTIRFFSGRTTTNEDTTVKLYDRWEAIPNPYGVFKKVQQISVDFKTDYNYPNALRPDTNPGYNTSYESEK